MPNDEVQVSSIQDVLEQYRKVAFDEYDKGAHFERLMQAFLQTEPQYEALYDEVWRWTEYSERGTRTDTGIDLVARNRSRRTTSSSTYTAYYTLASTAQNSKPTS